MKRILLVIGLVTVLAGAGWVYQTATSLHASAKTRQFNDDVDNLFRALQQYKEHVGAYPVGSNAEISKALKGKNSKNLIILSGNKENLNDKGEYVDPWGTPLRIYFSGEGVLVRSAGPNKRFDDSGVLNSDDYYRSN
jgi:Type II secretion system (T2SS), protein G